MSNPKEARERRDELLEHLEQVRRWHNGEPVRNGLGVCSTYTAEAIACALSEIRELRARPFRPLAFTEEQREKIAEARARALRVFEDVSSRPHASSDPAAPIRLGVTAALDCLVLALALGGE